MTHRGAWPHWGPQDHGHGEEQGDGHGVQRPRHAVGVGDLRAGSVCAYFGPLNWYMWYELIHLFDWF